jgi:hypothetical protein
MSLKSGALMPADHHHAGGDELAVGGEHAVGAPRRCARCASPRCSARRSAAAAEPGGSQQDAVGSLDDEQLQALVGVDVVHAVRRQFARRVVQLGGELDAGCAAADDPRELAGSPGGSWPGCRR